MGPSGGFPCSPILSKDTAVSPTIGNRQYIVNQSEDLLTKAPGQITVRVPVWRLDRSTFVREGRLVHPHDFVGYVTFKTAKIFTNEGDATLALYGWPRSHLGH